MSWDFFCFVFLVFWYLEGRKEERKGIECSRGKRGNGDEDDAVNKIGFERNKKEE